MELSEQKEEFSRAYVKAVAAACGYATEDFSVDEDSIDLGFAARGAGTSLCSPRLEMQLKCTARDVRGERTVDFPLPIKNYDDLRSENLLVPRILVVVVVPDELGQWLQHSEEELILRHCGYWCSLRGYPPTNNSHTVTINIPRTQLFDVASVTAIMQRIGNRGLP